MHKAGALDWDGSRNATNSAPDNSFVLSVVVLTQLAPISIE